MSRVVAGLADGLPYGYYFDTGNRAALAPARPLVARLCHLRS
jgi:hypothetical protein